jgi:molybdopterin synthase catalytic subunit
MLPLSACPPVGNHDTTTTNSLPDNDGGDTADTDEADNTCQIWVAVTDVLPSVQECYEYCASDPSCGAVSSFVGVTRDNFDGKTVIRLSYEAYESMACRVLRQLCREVQQRYRTTTTAGGIRRIVAVHKIGDCPVGQASVILMCASPHRQASLDATSYLIHELKARVPIWKREVYQGEEGSVWKENVEWHEGKQRRVMVKEP